MLVYDESDKHVTIYNDCNLESLSVFIQNVSIENMSIIYSISNELKSHISDATEKNMLYKQVELQRLLDSITDRLSHHPMYQELPTESKYYTNAGERFILIKETEKCTLASSRN